MGLNAEALPLVDARRLIDDAIVPVDDVEHVSLVRGLGRVLAHDLVARVAVPPHDNAAMDGYAVRVATLPALPATLRVVGSARAGRPYGGAVGPDDCVRIMTGAVIPEGCDAVVPYERVVVDDDRVILHEPVRPGQHRRLAGEDLRIGQMVLARGRVVTPSDLGLAASSDRSGIDVVRRLRVAVFSTGNELRDVGEPLGAGAVRDSNRYTLIGMLTRLGVDAIDLGIVRDDPEALEAVLARACGDDVAADAVVTSGGVSAGDADHTRDVMGRVGHVAFWKLAIKPGRPMAFGTLQRSGRRPVILFGLPGNPVAVMVVFYALVRDALLKMAGARVAPLPALTAIAVETLPKAKGRTEFIRGVIERVDSTWRVRTTGAQGSGILRSMSEANCLIVLDHERGPVAAGETVEAWPFDGLL